MKMKTKKTDQEMESVNASKNRTEPSAKRTPKKPRLLEPHADGLPILRFTPTAWAKLNFFCHYGQTEIGGFGITPAEDLLLIQEFVTVKQTTTEVSVNFDDEAVADFFESQVDAGRKA